MYSATEWAAALGAEIRQLDKTGESDSDEIYYRAVLAALEHLVTEKSLATGGALAERMEAWRRAYLSTPHGQPVLLEAGDRPLANDDEHGGHDHDREDHAHHHHDHHDH
jgi:hypothetical protein